MSPAPRYAPARDLPAYRHRLGRTPHPRTDPAGHSHGLPEPVAAPLTAASWRTHEAWLGGVDLFNRGYWWEAHELWEAAWRVTPDAETRHLLQGLIQVGAALLKWAAGNARGRRRLWQRGRAHLAAVPGDAGPVMGLALEPLLRQLDAAFAEVPTPPDGASLPPVPTVQLRLEGVDLAP